MRFYAVDLTSDENSTNVSFAKIRADSAKEAEAKALAMMARPEQWRCIGTDLI